MKTFTDHQEVFNTAYLGLKSQCFEKSYNPEGGVCQYHTTHGLKCAIGHCIPNELYDKNFEGKSAIIVQEILDHKSSLFFHIEAGFLRKLQNCHDRAETPKDMQEKLKDFANQQGLTIPE